MQLPRVTATIVLLILICSLSLFAVVGSSVFFTLGTNPGSPSAGKLTLWANAATGKLECLNSSGASCADTRESIGQKLRRLERAAQARNPLILPALIAPSAWVASTVYGYGTIVSNGGNWYITPDGGTAAGSGGPTGRGAAPITDNTITWYFYPTGVYASAATLPTISWTDSAIPGAQTLAYLTTDSPSAFVIAGGIPITYAGPVGVQFASVACASGTLATAGGAVEASVSFWTDAPKFTLKSLGNTQRIQVNGQYLQLSANHTIYNSGTGYLTIDYTAAGGRTPRLITIEISLQGSVGGVWVDPASKVWAPDTGDRIIATWQADSILSGSGNIPILPGVYRDSIVGKLLGWSDTRAIGCGGTGYIADSGGTSRKFLDHIADATSVSPDIHIVDGGINDVGQSGATIQAAALAYLQAFRTARPSTPIIVMGVYPGSSGPSAGVLTTENAIAAAVTQFADAMTWFIPVSTSAFPPLTGTGKVTSTTGTGNADVCIQADGTHPVDACVMYLGQWAAQQIRTVIQQIP